MTLNSRQFTPHSDEMDRVMGAERIGLPPKGARGGEWDAVRALPSQTFRSLRGAGYLRKGGTAPDVAATHHIGPGVGHDDTDAAMEWYVKTAQGAIQEQRGVRRRVRDQRLAESEGYKTPHERRNFRSVLKGHPGYAAERKAKQEGGG